MRHKAKENVHGDDDKDKDTETGRFKSQGAVLSQIPRRGNLLQEKPQNVPQPSFQSACGREKGVVSPLDMYRTLGTGAKSPPNPDPRRFNQEQASDCLKCSPPHNPSKPTTGTQGRDKVRLEPQELHFESSLSQLQLAQDKLKIYKGQLDQLCADKQA